MSNVSPTLVGLIDLFVDAEVAAGRFGTQATADTVRSSLRRFVRETGVDDPSAVTTAVVAGFLAGLPTYGSRRSALAMLRRFWREMVAAGHVAEDPAADDELLPRKVAGAKPKVRGSGGSYLLVEEYVRRRREAGQLASTTAPGIRAILHRWASFVGGRPPAKWTRRDVDAFVGRPGVVAATRRRDLATIRTFCAWLLVEGLADHDPTVGVARIREPRKLPRGLKPEQAAAVLAAVPDLRAKLIVELMLLCGCRAVEVSRLAMADVDRTERTIRLDGKGRHERVVPVPAECWATLEAYLAEHPATTGPLVRSTVDSKAGLTNQYVSALVTGVIHAAGVEASGHALRHTYAGVLLRRGVHLRDVQQLLGHSNIAVTDRYMPLNVGDLRAAVEPLAPPLELDPSPAVIDVVAGLVNEIRELRRQVAAITAGGPSTARSIPGPPEPEERVTCPECGMTGGAGYMRACHLGYQHCPDCGQLPLNRGLRAHRFYSHGVRWPAEPVACDRLAEPHPHTPTGLCICPWCRQQQLGHGDWAARHFARRHRPCPDCDGSYIRLAAHRQRAHPWGARDS